MSHSFRSLEARPGWVKIAWAGFWVGLPPELFFRMHAWVTGASGSGKTFYLLAALYQLLQDRTGPTVILDCKGELSRLLQDLWLPALGRTEVRIIRPFATDYLPPLRITAPEKGTAREIQAYTTARAIEEGLGVAMGHRMSRILLHLTSLAIERNEPLTVVREWLLMPELFVRAAKTSGNHDLRVYAATFLDRENKDSLDAVLSRLDMFLFLDETRMCLSAPTCFSFNDALESGLTIVNLGEPPAGAEAVARLWAGLLLGKLMRAILSRPVDAHTPPAWIIFEEFQEAVSGNRGESFERLLALARYKKVAMWFVNQQPSQLDASLARLLRNNTSIQVAFRCTLEDAKAFAHALPIPPGIPDARAYKRELVHEMTRFPRRVHYFWLKSAPFMAQKVLSPKLPLEEIAARARAAAPDLREAIRRGSIAVPKSELAHALPTHDLVVVPLQPRRSRLG